MTKIPDRVEVFLSNNARLIDENPPLLFKKAAEVMSSWELSNLCQLFEEAGIPTQDIRLQAYEISVQEFIDTELNSTSNTKSNQWSRFQYMFESLPSYGFRYDELKKHLLNNADRLNITMTPLETQYGWWGDGDYDLGWFNKIEFEKECRENGYWDN